jgi:hypothetical protein|tara:strand:+ start:82 stop:291 length:210 start_codon:yes stop_codon:yes gene_type:complete
MNDWIKWGEANPPRFLQRADETVFVVRNETVTQTTNENKNPAMKGNRNPFAQNSVRSMKAACKGRKVIK